MKVKAALIIFGAWLIVLLVLLSMQTPWWAQGLKDADSIVGVTLFPIFIASLGFFGTLIYWLGTRLKKWMLGY